MAHNGDDGVENGKAKPEEEVAGKELIKCPWNENSAGAENRKNVDKGRAQCDEDGPMHAKDGKPDRQLDKGDCEQNGISPGELEHGVDPAAFDAKQHGFAFGWQKICKKAGDLIVIDHKEKAGDNHEQRFDKEGRHMGGKTGEGRHRTAGNTADGAAQRSDNVLVERGEHGLKGGV